jgi:RHS repeat-associated protein
MAYLESAGISAAPYQGQKASTAQDSIMKNVNLYRGAVSTNITLASLDGLDGLDVAVAACYKPEDGNFFKPNRSCASGILGTGLTMPLAAILVRNRTVRENYQSNYFIIGEGGEFPLYRIGSADDFVTFLSVEHPFWRFNRYTDRWEVTKEDGSVWTYGAYGDSTEVNVCWDNWTGACADFGGEQFAVGWYLSKIVSRYGNCTAFTYENIRRPLLGGSYYTSEMHLKTAVSSFGQTIAFNYLPKTDNEYCLPHAITEDGDPYQFLCERHFLDSLDIYAADSILLHSQKLSYDLVPAAPGETKRLLTSVSQVNADGEVMPPLTLAWNTAGDFAGHLSKLIYPREGSLAFAYQATAAERYAPDTFLSIPPDGEWEKTVSNGSDFTAILFTKNDSAILRVFSWDMSWQIYEDADFNARPVKDASLYLGDGTVTVRYLNPLDNAYSLRIVKRSPVKRYDWEGFDVALGCASCPSVACGADFVAVQYPDRNGMQVYQFNYTDNAWHRFDLQTDIMGHQIIGAGNGCVFGAYGYDDGDTVRLAAFYCDEAHQWHNGGVYDMPAHVNWKYESVLPVWSINGGLASACFLSDEGDALTASVIAVKWDSAYEITGAQMLTATQPQTAGNPLFYSVTTDTMIGFANTAMRYTPSGFRVKTLFDAQDDCEYAYAYGCDLFLGVEKAPNGGQRFYAARYDARSSSWTEAGAPYADILSGCAALCRPLVAADYAVLGNAVFSRGADDNWNNIGFLPVEADPSTVRLDPNGGYLLYCVPQAQMTRFVPLSPTGLGESTDIYGALTGSSSSYEAGANSFFLSAAPGQVAGLSLYNLYRQTYYQTEAPSVTLLQSVTLDSGLEKQSVFLAYDMASARLENGAFAAGTASVMPAAKDASFGKTVFSYYNGGAPTRVQYPPVDTYNNAADFYSHFAGQSRYTASYDGSGAKTDVTACDMKAFDTHGFCIQQTRLTRSDFVKRFLFSGGVNATAQSIDEIQSSVEYEYEPTYYRRRKTIKKSFDKNGKELCLSYTTRYAFEDYPEMEAANILGDVVLSTGFNETENTLLDAKKYVYTKHARGFFYPSAEMSRGKDENEWFTVSTTLVSDRGQKLCETGERGLPTSYVYDTYGLYPVAVTRYASPGEALYCGFEPYEDLSGLIVDGGIENLLTADAFFSGSRCLKLGAGVALTAPVKTAVAGSGVRVRVSVKSAYTVDVTVDFGGAPATQTLSPADGGCWNTYIKNFPAPHKGACETATVTISCADKAYIDALYITPEQAEGEAYVYSGALKLQTASHRNCGCGTRTYFDRFDTPCAYVRDDGSFVSYSNTVYKSGGNPNEMTALKSSSSGYWYDVRQGYHANPLFSPSEDGGWVFAQADCFSLIFSSYGDTMPSLSFCGAMLSFADGIWTLTNNACVQTAPMPGGNHYTLIKVGTRCRFSGDGTYLFDFTVTGDASLAMADAQDVRCIGYIPAPDVNLSCADYSGRVLQDQEVTQTGLRIVHTLYNPLGVQAARTAQAEIPGAFWGYRSGYVTAYDENTGLTAGEICSLFPEAEGFPCSAFKTSLCSQPQVTEAANPGKVYALGGGYTVRHASCSGGGFDAFMADGFCFGEAITDPDGAAVITLSDGKGKVMNARVSADGKDMQITAYENDGRGNPIKIFYPNYFSGAEDADTFVSVLTYDALGNMASRKDPNADMVLTVYDKYGSLRFIKQDETGGMYVYHLYDEFGRKTEIGYVQAPWDDAALRTAAEGECTRPQDGVPVREMFYGESGDYGDPADQTNQLTRVITTVNGDTVEERYTYDKFGRRIQYALTTNGVTEQCFTTYDNAGNVTTRRTSRADDGELSYAYDLNGALASVSYNGTVIYRCGYSPRGGLAYETFGGESDAARREYAYNTADYLTGITDPFFSQTIAYAGANGIAQAGAKKNGQVSSVETTFHFDGGGDFRKTNAFSCTYDALGRVNGVTVSGGAADEYQYDPNGNIALPGVKYTPGADRLAEIGGNAVAYAGFGALKSIGGVTELSYEPVTQSVTGVTAGGVTTSYVVGGGIGGYDDGDGLTLSVQSEDGKTFFERGANGTVLLVYGANGVFAQICGGKVYYLIKDYRSSVCAVLSEGKVSAAYSYDLFGGLTDAFESAELPAGLIPLRFAGARLEKSGLYRFKARFYDPGTGRFLSPDPEGQYPNPYLYGGCDWINYFDPDGAWSWQSLVTGLIGVALVAVGIVVTVMTAGIGGAAGVALGIVGAGIIGGGISSMIYGITSAINGDFSWNSWGIQVGMGAAFGMVSAGIGAAMPVMGAAASIAYDAVSGMVVGACDGLVTNGVLNVENGKAFFDNVVSNVTIGAVLGGFMGAVSGMSTAARNAKNLVRKSGPAQGQLGIANSLGETSNHACGYHSRMGIRPGNTGNSVEGGHLVYGAAPGSARVTGTTLHDGEQGVQWINISPNAYGRLNGSFVPVANAGRYNSVFNSCTGYVIRMSSNAGIYQPLWARGPVMLSLWTRLTRAFQS